jgi:hypothetical protein
MRRVVFALTLVAALVSLAGLVLLPVGSASRGGAAPLPLPRPTPTPATPVAVPGSNLHQNVATPKTGYGFAQNGKAVDVQDNRRARRMGAYICMDGPGMAWPLGCYIQFSPSDITCKGVPSGGGICLLTAAPPPMLSPR